MEIPISKQIKKKKTTKKAKKTSMESNKIKVVLRKEPSKQDLIDILPEMSFHDFDKVMGKPNTKFFMGYECISLGMMWLFAGYNPELQIFYGWVKMDFAEWGVIDYDDLKFGFDSASSIKQLTPMLTTFKNGPRTAKDLNSIFVGYEIDFF